MYIEEVEEDAKMSNETSPLIELTNNSQLFSYTQNQSTLRNRSSSSSTKDEDGFSQDSQSGQENQQETRNSIGSLGSFVLIINNLTGPGMLGFPHLFKTAGIFPILIMIIFVSICSSLCGTFLADAIASISGNHHFEKNIDFSSAFKLLVGKQWYLFAEVLFLISCGVQTCAAIVESAQSLDGFLASFCLGKTFALQLYPVVSIITWSSSHCKKESDIVLLDQAEIQIEEDCTPFHNAGGLIISLGFLITAMIFYPLGTGHLKETITLQYISFVFMMILLVQFTYQFVSNGIDHEVPMVGPDFANLAGVILFNYAYSITVPAWLMEKHKSVSVNRTIWSATTSASLIYFGFGLLGAMAFQQVSPNILIMLTSSKVHFFTQFCAALFGLIIIGSGIPVFSVIIRTALITNEVCTPFWALFCGSCLPYLLSWMLYQGTILLNVLNWTGLIVNGLVAFLLPMVLALKSTQLRTQRAKRIEMIVLPTADGSVDQSSGQHIALIPHKTQPLANSPPSDKKNRAPSLRVPESPSDSNKSPLEVLSSPNVLFVKENDQVDQIFSEEKQFLGDQSPAPLIPHDQSLDCIDPIHGETYILTKRSSFPSIDPEANNLSPINRTPGSTDDEKGFDSDSVVSDHQTNSVKHHINHFMQTRIFFNTTVHPLPFSLEYYRREIVLFMMTIFSGIILFTIGHDLVNGLTREDEEFKE